MVILAFYFLIIFGIAMLPRYIRYSESDYKSASGNNFFETIFDKGNYGEFLTFSYLEKLGGNHKIMTNLYLPKKDGSTTEIDLIMLSPTGIYVFESKNYSGWIFGDENNRNWTQTLRNKQKNRFFNPIWQNKGHINALKSVIDSNYDNIYKSYIVFSERCTLKKINVISSNVKVIKRNALINTIRMDINNSEKIMTVEEINKLYSKLQKYTCVDEEIKKAHVDNIKARMYSKADLNNNGKDTNYESRKEYFYHEKSYNYQNLIPCTLSKRVIAALIDLYSYGLVGYFYKYSNEIITSIVLLLVLGFQMKLWTKGQSIGKKMIKIQTIDVKTQKPLKFLNMMLRTLIGKYIINTITHGLGFITIFFTKKKQGLHDIIFKSMVIDITVEN